MPSRVSRRDFLKVVAAGAAAAAATYIGFEGILSYERNTSTTTPNSSGISTSFNRTTPSRPRYVRIRAIETSGWDCQYPGVSYSPQQILNTINDLQPTLLERYINGLPAAASPDYLLPGGVNIVDFLNASVDAGAIGCYMTPRLGCELIYNNGGDTSQFFDLSTRYLDFPVSSPWREVSLDNTIPFSLQYPNMVQSVLQELYNQGWKSVGVADFTSYVNDYGLATFTLLGFNKSNSWQVNTQLLDKIRTNSPNIKRIIGTVDYPGPTQDLLNVYNSQGGDAVANILKYIFENQSQYGYTYSPDILMDDSVVWDSTKLTYSGGTMYDLIKSELEQYD